MKNKSITKVVLGMMGIGMAFLMAGCGKPTINLNDYIVVEEHGVNGYGSVSMSVDWDELEADYGDKLDTTKEAKKNLAGIFALMTPVEWVNEFVYLDEESNSYLSNGDQVSYQWDVDETYKEILDCNFKWEDGAYTVETLEEVGTFDAFADIEVSFNGISPNGSVNLVSNSELISTYDIMVSQDSDLSNGDVITVSLENLDMAKFAQEYGKIPAELVKEYTVEGLESYASSIDQINEEDLAQLVQLGEDTYVANAASDWEEGVTLESIEYVGNYFLTPKFSDSARYENIIFLVYRAKANIDYTSGDQNYKGVHDIYWCYAPKDVVLDAEGQVKPIEYSVVPVYDEVDIDTKITYFYWSDSTIELSFDGYESLEMLKEENITTCIDEYNFAENF